MENSIKRQNNTKITLETLLDNKKLEKGDVLIFNKSKLETDYTEKPDNYWKATLTGLTDRSNNLKWSHDGEKYSITELANKIVKNIEGESKKINGYSYWKVLGKEETLWGMK